MVFYRSLISFYISFGLFLTFFSFLFVYLLLAVEQIMW